MPGDDGMRQPDPRIGDHGAQLDSRCIASDELERWLESEFDKTLGSVIELFEEKSFALLFILLLGR